MAVKKEIYDAVDDVKEYLALNKWNEAMMLIAQISIKVIESLTDEALIVSKGNYEEDLKTLQNSGVINDATAHNLGTLIICGVQARSGVDVPSDYVKKAFTVLEDELKVLYENDLNVGVAGDEDKIASSNAEMKQEPSIVYEEEQGDEGSVYEDDDEPAFINRDGDIDFRQKERLRKQALNVSAKLKKLNFRKLLVIIIPILTIIAVAIIIKSCVGNKNVEDIKNAEPYSFEETEGFVIEDVTEEETTPAYPPEAGMWNVIGDIVWIRDQANTTSSKKLVSVNKGDQVRVLRVIQGIDRKWAIINYDGKEAFIAYDYLSPTDEVRDELRRRPMEITTTEQ